MTTLDRAIDAPLISPSARLVVIVLARDSDESGSCVTSVTALAARAQMERRTVQRQLAWLVAKGWVSREPVGRLSTRFTLHLERRA